MKTYEELLSLPIDKSKIISIWDNVGDLTQNWQHVVDNNHKYISFFLSEISKYFDINNIKTIFDVGSLNGIESVYFAQFLPHSNIYSFEANPNSVKLVESNQKYYSNTKCINKAISDYVGKSTFFLSNSNIGASSLLKPIGGPAGLSYSSIDVDVITIKQFSDDNNIDKVDVLWMDLQGNELNALKGMGDMLNETMAICSEIGLISYYENHTLFKDIHEYLKTFGFEISETPFPFPYTSKGGTPDPNSKSWECDIIFINKRLYEKNK